MVGYNALTPATIGNRTGLALGPLGVAKDRQGEGVGTALVRESISRAKAMGYSWIVVLGGDYYLRFDFEPAVPYGVYIQKDCAENAYLKLLFLNETDREGLTGKIIYCETFYDENGRLL